MGLRYQVIINQAELSSHPPPRIPGYHATAACHLRASLPLPATLILGDLFAFEPATLTWTELAAPAVRGSPPSPRFMHGFAAAEGRLYVHGGVRGGNGEFKVALSDRQRRSLKGACGEIGRKGRGLPRMFLK